LKNEFEDCEELDEILGKIEADADRIRASEAEDELRLEESVL